MPVPPNSRQFYYVYEGRIYRFPLDKKTSTFNLSNVGSCEEVQISANFTKVLHIYPIAESTLAIAGHGKDGNNCTWLCNVEGSTINPFAQISDNLPLSLESDLHITYILTDESTIEIWDHKLSQPFKKKFEEAIVAIEISTKLGILAAFGEKNIHLIEDESVHVVKHNSSIKLSNERIHPLAWGPLKTLAIGGDRVVRYISGSKWSIYSFQTVLGSTHTTTITLTRFLVQDDNTLLITVSNDSLIIWDFDEETQLNKIDKSLSWPSVIDFFQKDYKLFLYYLTDDPAEFHVESLEIEGKRKNLLKTASTFVDLDAEESPVQEELFDSPTKHSTSTHSSLDDDNTIVGPEYQNNSLHTLVINLQQKIHTLESIIGNVPKNSDTNDIIITPGQCPPPIDAANQWCMFWNQLGHASKSCVLGNQTIHVYMFSGPHAGNIKIADKYNCSLVSLETEAYAVSADIQDSDAAHSIISFSLFTGAATWERRTRLGETVKAISLGSTFLAAVTTANTLYVFSPGGSLLLASQLSGPCVALAGHGPLLIVITQASGIGNSMYSTYQHVLYLVDSVRGYSKDRSGCLTMLSRETFSLQNDNVTGGIDWINISDNLICHIRFHGTIYGLYPTSIDINGQFILQWVPLINMIDVGNFVNSLLFPLYIELDKICYIKLRPGHPYPTSNVPVNFFGYTLLKSHLRIEPTVASTLPLKKYNSLLSSDPQLKEMIKDEEGKMKMVEDVVALDWITYDEMRYRLSLYANQFNLTSLFTQSGAIDPTTNIPIESWTNKINECHKASDKWALRIIRKTVEDKKTQCTAREALYMIKGAKGLDIAASIIGPINQKFVEDARNIKLRRIDAPNNHI